MNFTNFHIIVSFILFITSFIGCNDKPLLLNSRSLEDSLSVYLNEMEDIENWANNPMTTFVLVFERNDSLIVSFDSQPENYRITIPGYSSGFEPVKRILGYYNNKLVILQFEEKYVKTIENHKLRKLSSKEKSALKNWPIANESGWGKEKYYREYYIRDEDSIELLKSINPELRQE